MKSISLMFGETDNDSLKKLKFFEREGSGSKNPKLFLRPVLTESIMRGETLLPI